MPTSPASPSKPPADEETVVYRPDVDDATVAVEPAVRPEDPTVTAIDLPRLSGASGHPSELRDARAELGRLRSQLAGLLNQEQHPEEEGADLKTTA
ncbi:MAG: hypothetical protein L0H84_19785, partial [Pseudonocardia sp.]|nr:hypothetical protein [Pseudonocardia sp.]